MEKYRTLVPVAARDDVTYLNASFQPPMNLRVRAALDTFLDQAVHETHPKPGWQGTAQQAQAGLAAYLKVPTESVVFTRDTTEGLNLFQRSIPFQQGDNVVVLDSEHPNHAYGWLGLIDKGLEVRRVETNGDTFANAETYAPLVDSQTIAIGLSSIMFHSGQMNDIKDICERFRPQGIHVLVDITQHVGVAPIDLTSWGVSVAAFGLHKGMGCLGGLGGLYIHPDVLPSLKGTPPIVGAGSIANLPASLVANPDVQYHPSTQRYGHLNISFISAISLNASLKFLAKEIGMQRIESHLRSLGREMAIQLKPLGVEIVGSERADRRAPHLYILKLLHPDWVDHFQKENIIVSHYRCGVRVSFGFYNNLSDVRSLVASIERGLKNGVPRN
ncbi:PLP-dependent transferase [Aspergillus steynii IBT 23096]|uniref:PLP-dependent transferase n=1 Tax=Aspergillus steynii IBT 23096 TaxID=1392250 RepID=A0A2I2GI68_9EURO|nr:PLP-dependent transferase [Aspergillus steynii IBT 23096]PLB52537.1 PLP-dependent transferase [Aspergillus steynii IBT 23096]